VNRRAWILFTLVAVLWGIPYLLIKIAIDDLSPIVVVAGRVAIAALVLVPVAAVQGTLPALRRNIKPVVVLGVVHIVGPFLLITYGEVHISSSLTGLLIAIEPVLVGLDISGDRWGLLGAAMILLATLLYAVATVYVQRRASDIPPTALVAGTTTVSTVLLVPFAAFALPTAPVSGGAWAALLALGLLCTATALLAFYRLIGEVGPSRAGLVTYANPVVAVLLGVAILDEPLRLSTVLGFLLIVAGCWLSTRPTVPAALDTPVHAQ
jgi:drug/metabolite transporter (DMT)-like permease